MALKNGEVLMAKGVPTYDKHNVTLCKKAADEWISEVKSETERFHIKVCICFNI